MYDVKLGFRHFTLLRALAACRGSQQALDPNEEQHEREAATAATAALHGAVEANVLYSSGLTLIYLVFVLSHTFSSWFFESIGAE